MFASVINGYINAYSGLKRRCWQGIILSLLESTFIGIYYFLPLYFVNELKISIATSGLIISFYGLGAICGGFIGGKLSDKFSPSLVSIASIFIQAIILLSLINLKSVNALFFCLFILGMASYSFITSNYIFVLNQCKKDEGIKLKAINMLTISSNLGLGLSAIIIGYLANVGFDKIFFYSSISLFIFAFYFWNLEIHNKNKTENNIQTINENINDINNNSKNIGLILLCVFLIGLIIFQSSTTYAIYIKEKFPQWNMKGVSILYAINCFLIVLFQMPIINFFRNINKISLIGLGSFLLGLSMTMLNFAFVFTIAVIACVIHTLGEMLFFSSSQLLCYELARENQRGRALGLYRMIYASSRIVAPASGAFIYQSYGPIFLWEICGIIGIVCLIICFLQRY